MYLSVSKFDSVDWRVDYILGSSEIETIKEPNLQLRLKLRDTDTDAINVTSFSISSEKFRTLLSGKLHSQLCVVNIIQV